MTTGLPSQYISLAFSLSPKSASPFILLLQQNSFKTHTFSSLIFKNVLLKFIFQRLKIHRRVLHLRPVLHLRTETNQDPLMRSPSPAKSESPTTEEISVSGEPDPPTTKEFTDVKSFPSSSSSTAYNFHFDFDFLELLKLILKLILYSFFKLY